ncbi:MAG: FtsX-like permease family protein, partial [Clostridiales Family XIII bacterium]|nr:FtsX-like permease family protein [Clostridiales Family XIII bacterium]
MKTIDKRLLRMIGDTKSQFAAVSVILAVGLAFYMSMGLAALNLRQGMERYYDEYRFADLSCQAGGVSLRQVRALEELPGVAEAEGRFTRTVPLLTEDADGRGRAEIVTVPAGNGGINRLLLEEGSLLQAGSRDVLVIRQLAAARDIRPGDRIRMQINGQAMEFPVAGIVSSPEFIYLADPDQGIMPDNKNYGVIYMEENFGRQLLGAQGGYNDIQILEENGLSGTERDDLAKTIEERLEDYGGQGAVQRAEQFSNVMISDEIGQLETMAAALPVLFLLIAALILVMMLGRMVKRDRQSIGILKGLGYSSAQVVSHYVKYSLLAGLAGGVAGAAAGMGLAGALTTYYMEFFFLPDLNRITDYQYIPQAILLSCLFCAAAGLLGTRGVFAVSPSESMKTESPGTGRRILLERARFLWRRLSFSQKLATKNVFRNKKRALFIFTGIMVTYGMMVFVLTMPAMLSDMMGKGLEEFQPMDYNVSFKAPLSEKALVDIRRIVGDVTELEGKVEYPFRLESGPRDIALTVIGVERGTAFYRFRGQDGRAYEVPEDGILLSGYAAKKLRAGVGDLVLLHAYLPGAEDVWAEVTGVIYQAMGVNAYMDKAAMARAYLTPGAVTGFYMNSGDPDA